MADFNGDGKMDFAVGLQGGSIAIYFGIGDGTFQAPATVFRVLPIGSLAVGDLRGTGLQDIVTVSGSQVFRDPSFRTAFIDRYWNNGDGTFVQGPGFPLFPGVATCDAAACTAIRIADMNGGGRPDLVLLSVFLPGSLSVYLGNGDGTFQNAITTALGAPPGGAHLAVADFNRDGKADVAFVGSSSEMFGVTPVILMLGNGDGTFKAPLALPNGSPDGPLVVGDFNTDGIPDLAIGVCAPNNCDDPPQWSLQVFMGRGDGTFRAPLTRTLGFGLRGSWLETANINGGSEPDLVTLGYGTLTGWRLYVLYGDGDGTFQAPFEVASVSQSPNGLNASVAGAQPGGAPRPHYSGEPEWV